MPSNCDVSEGLIWRDKDGTEIRINPPSVSDMFDPITNASRGGYLDDDAFKVTNSSYGRPFNNDTNFSPKNGYRSNEVELVSAELTYKLKDYVNQEIEHIRFEIQSKLDILKYEKEDEIKSLRAVIETQKVEIDKLKEQIVSILNGSNKPILEDIELEQLKSFFDEDDGEG